jgi:DNA-binding CsgD family transcriptional regulator
VSAQDDDMPKTMPDGDAEVRAQAAPVAPVEPGELTETQLEALLFVAERPLSRAEIAQVAGVDRDTVDARIGDLQVSLASRGIRLVESAERVELATSP